MQRAKFVIFVCHGNICRSTMAEFLFRYLAEAEGCADRFSVISRATSREELGNPVHPGTREVLSRLGISTKGKFAQQITREECDGADYIIVMDRLNRRGLAPFLGQNEHKVSFLLEWAGLDRDIADPWWTGNFEETYEDVMLGCRALLKALCKDGNV